MQYLDEVIAIVADISGESEDVISENTHFRNDLNLDSLDQIELELDIEQTFDIAIPDDFSGSIQTVGDAVRYVQQATKNRASQDPYFNGNSKGL